MKHAVNVNSWLMCCGVGLRRCDSHRRMGSINSAMWFEFLPIVKLLI